MYALTNFTYKRFVLSFQETHHVSGCLGQFNIRPCAIHLSQKHITFPSIYGFKSKLGIINQIIWKDFDVLPAVLESAAKKYRCSASRKYAASDHAASRFSDDRPLQSHLLGSKNDGKNVNDRKSVNARPVK